MYAQNEQLKQKMDEMRLVIGQCEGERGEAQTARANLAKCKIELTSTHDQCIFYCLLFLLYIFFSCLSPSRRR